MKILVATDGSTSADLALQLVAGVDWPAGSSIRVVQAVETGTAILGGMWPPPGPMPIGDLENEALGQAEETVGRLVKRLARSGLFVDSTVLRGRPATAIAMAAAAMPADVIVMGNRGHGTIPSMVLGSVSAEVIDHASVPVLVARGRSIERLTLAWDGSPYARRAAEAILGWPIFAGAIVQVVSVAHIALPWWTGFPVPGSAETAALSEETADATRHDRDALAAAMAAELSGAGLHAEPIGREGDPAAEIIDAARAAGSDVVVIGTHGRTGLARLALGSVARNVLHHAPCSVLIVPPARRGEPQQSISDETTPKP